MERRFEIGRSSQATLVLNDPDVSRLHAVLLVREDGVWLRDLGSGNGTWVNGVRIRERRLGEGDRLQFGPIAFRLFTGAAPVSRGPRLLRRGLLLLLILAAMGGGAWWRFVASAGAPEPPPVPLETPPPEVAPAAPSPPVSVRYPDPVVAERVARYFEKGDPRAVIAALRRGLPRKSRSEWIDRLAAIDARESRARNALRRGALDEAETERERLARLERELDPSGRSSPLLRELDRELAEGFLAQGRSLRERGDPEGAHRAFERGLRLAPSHPLLQNERAASP